MKTIHKCQLHKGIVLKCSLCSLRYATMYSVVMYEVFGFERVFDGIFWREFPLKSQLCSSRSQILFWGKWCVCSPEVTYIHVYKGKEGDRFTVE